MIDVFPLLRPKWGDYVSPLYAVAWFLANAADFLVTSAGLQHGLAREVNPFATAYLASYGIGGILLLKALATSLLLAAAMVSRRASGALPWVTWAVAALVLWNLSILARSFLTQG